MDKNLQTGWRHAINLLCRRGAVLALLPALTFTLGAEDEGAHAGPAVADEAGELLARSAAHAPTADKDQFHFTALRAWYYHDFLPNSDDPDVLGIELNSAWGWGGFDVMNISYLELAEYPKAVPGKPAGNLVPGIEPATGITDLLSAFLFSPQREHHSNHHFAYGAAIQLPTATHDILGSGKWSIGPAVEYEYHRDKFYAAFVALQLWSVAGASDRKDVSMLMIKPMITYDLSEHWKAVYMPYGISVYWDKPADQAIYLPLGGGVQRNFQIGAQEMAISAQYFNYVLRPDSGSEQEIRFLLEFDF